MLFSMTALPVYAADVDNGEDDAQLADTGASADDIAPSSFNLLTEEEFQLKLAQLRQKYPDGSVWEGIYYENGVYKAETCWAYACQMMYEIFDAMFYTDGILSKYKDYDSNVNAGDWVRIDWDSHSIFITKVTADGIYYTDGNGTGVYNQVRWDGYMTWSEFNERFSWRVHLPGNDLVGTEVFHTIAYDANGGSGRMSSQEIDPGDNFTLKENEFYREDHTFAGYTVKRSSDNKWYTSDAGWQSLADIYDNNYTFKIYPQGREYTLGTPWIGGITYSTIFTFYAQWLPDYSTVEFMSNYSGYNYLLGSDLGDDYSDYIYSRDTSVYSLSVSSAERLNNTNSLKIVGKSAGSSGSDLTFYTSTNYGYGDGYSTAGLVGDNKDMTLRFMAKSSVEGATMYIRWGFSSSYESVDLTTEWKTYYVSVPKNRYNGSALHPFFDTAGTFYLNSLTLGDDVNTNVVAEPEDWACSEELVARGGRISRLPVPHRDGYTFTGWYTAAEGGDQVTSTTVIEESRLRLYAHWSKDVSRTPVKTVSSNGHTYELYDNVMGWEEAASFCESMGGHLVTIDNASENTLAYNMISDRQGYCWIGLSYNTSKGQWQWVTGENTSYKNWYKASYGTDDSGEYYAMMYPMDLGTTPYASKWDKCVGSDYHCSYYGYYNSFFICEYDEATLLGDADCNGWVESVDATFIQRVIAESVSDGEAIRTRGDVDGDGRLSIIDAGWIQRYFADMYTPYKIGEVMSA